MRKICNILDGKSDSMARIQSLVDYNDGEKDIKRIDFETPTLRFMLRLVVYSLGFYF